ncbi:unnamed protein product [Strongylus vulgaris]|uniref:Uncharacterized protein n=1 Tax=Strongylus vulgaris TaxID=40348 RepID=A0A3P7LQW3_STRVU|nr:unnamed protein product [Strongylus vulgaris]
MLHEPDARRMKEYVQELYIYIAFIPEDEIHLLGADLIDHVGYKRNRAGKGHRNQGYGTAMKAISELATLH